MENFLGVIYQILVQYKKAETQRDSLLELL